ncbi:MAG: GNAT family N-acetyltransferase [Herpetosiphonaceae bacterium]|nr:GNAT family N-acetyltransferase [Herpetosiphonaceae bacterium]
MLTIEGVQIRLRDWRLTDLEDYEHWLLPGHRWREFDGPYCPEPSASQIIDIVDRKRKQIMDSALPTPRTNLTITLPNDDLLLGTVTWAWESQETYWLTIGIVIFDPTWWGHGLGYEALGLWSDYLFREMPQIVRLDLRTWSGNDGMVHLAQKLGYELEARFRKARIVKGQYYDGLGYGVLRDSWERRYSTGFAGHLQHSKKL